MKVLVEVLVTDDSHSIGILDLFIVTKQPSQMRSDSQHWQEIRRSKARRDMARLVRTGFIRRRFVERRHASKGATLLLPFNIVLACHLYSASYGLRYTWQLFP